MTLVVEASGVLIEKARVTLTVMLREGKDDVAVISPPGIYVSVRPAEGRDIKINKIIQDEKSYYVVTRA